MTDTRFSARPLQKIDPSAAREMAETGAWHLRAFLVRDMQDAFVAAARQLKGAAPLVHPTMRDGTPLSVRVSSFGARGWWGDRDGFRYVAKHPTTKLAFPPLPDVISDATYAALCEAAHYSALCIPHWTSAAWTLPDGLSSHVAGLDTCLVNHYGPGAQLGWHIDKTELDKCSPIVTFSIGATCTFELRMEVRGEMRTWRHTLASGDAIVMAGPSRIAEHRVIDIRADDQADLFAANYNPIAASAPGTRLSFTVRRTGF